MIEEKNCITCANFAWWDGDYCCMKKLAIICESKDGSFSDELMANIKINDGCSDHKDSYGEHKEMLTELFNKYKNK